MDGRAFLKGCADQGVPGTIIMMSAYGSVDDAIDCMRLGAYDYIGKPFNGAELRARVAAAYRARTLQRELAQRTLALEAALAELAEAQQRATERAKLAAIGTMVAGLAHELNNPLGIVLAQADRALRTELPPRARDALASILRQAGRCVSLTRSLLSLSRDEGSAMAPASVQVAVECVVEAARPQAEEGRVEIVVRAADDLPRVLACEGDLETAIGNLLRNAVQASPTGAQVQLSARRSPARGAGVGAGTAGVEIVVRDRGPGIPAALRERLFEPFFTTKEPGKGTGLGLSLARCAVERCGGSLALEPADDGLLARMWLPAAEAS